jgi:hypothetical protein
MNDKESLVVKDPQGQERPMAEARRISCSALRASEGGSGDRGLVTGIQFQSWKRAVGLD